VDLTFRRLTDGDLPTLHRWLNEPGVVRWWEGDDVSWKGVVGDYGSGSTDSTEHWVASLAGRDVGWIQCYPTADEPKEAEKWWGRGVDRTAAGIDYLVGDPADRGHGLGSAMIRAFVADVVFALHPGWTQACADPHAENVASWRALERAGFRFVGTVEGKDGPGRLMVTDRPPQKGTDRPAGRSRGFVDYDRVASLYRQGRSLPQEVLDRWGSAVSPFLPPGPIRVLDVGAGTGVFAQVWPQWATARVVAIEPSAAMVRAGDVVHPDASFVRCGAEALPVRDASTDVIWVSTALHHFFDVHRSVEEFARVLASAGQVLVRTYAPGRTEVTWANEFPGRPKWEMRFHTEDQLHAIFGAHGFVLSSVRDVVEWRESFADSARWAERMRDADSLLTALTDEEIAEGLERLRSNPTKIGRLELTLFVFRKDG